MIFSILIYLLFWERILYSASDIKIDLPFYKDSKTFFRLYKATQGFDLRIIRTFVVYLGALTT